MNNRQQSFIDHYVGDCQWNATKAAIAAGYAANSARQNSQRLLTKDYIKKAVVAAKAEKAEKIDVTVEFIVQALLDGLSMARNKQDLPAMARFSELLGKYKAMFTDNINQHIDEQQAIEATEQAEAKRLAAIRLRETA